MLLFVFFTFKISFIKKIYKTKTVLIPSISILLTGTLAIAFLVNLASGTKINQLNITDNLTSEAVWVRN